RSFNRMAAELEASRHQIEASSRDLSAANMTLEQRSRHIETILESIPTGVLSLDANRRITHVNHALLRMFTPGRAGEAPKLLIGAALPDVFPPDVLEDLEPLLRRADRMGMTTTQMEITLQRSKFNVAVTVATLQHAGKELGYVVVFEDLSDLLRAQKQAACREVARRVSHEINNPLTAIALSAEPMQGEVVREIHIFTSLVASRDAVEITVADTGHGVTQELKERLFLPYFSTKKRGTGLGLAIVSRIIEDHHGSIRVEENQPVGARFVVELPLAPESLTAPASLQHA